MPAECGGIADVADSGTPSQVRFLLQKTTKEEAAFLRMTWGWENRCLFSLWSQKRWTALMIGSTTRVTSLGSARL
jgi:hypothetical protein